MYYFLTFPPLVVLDVVTGLSSTKEKAQDYVLTGAGLLAGSSILLLTLLWGACFICGRKEFYVQPDLKQKNRAMQLLTGLHSSSIPTVYNHYYFVLA